VAAFDFLDEINPKTEFVDQTTELLPNQSNISSHDTLPELTNKGPDNMVLSNGNKEKRTISENSETVVKSQATADLVAVDLTAPLSGKNNVKVSVIHKPSCLILSL
jgi:hypothetical protein